MPRHITVALGGNPNSGKTTLFNALTGARHSVGNWPGVTVEKKEGDFNHKDHLFTVVDLPGTYSLSPYSIEEKVSRNYIVEENPDVVVNIVDASNIERNLYLSMQLIELGKPVVIALNMMDVALKRDVKIKVDELSKALGVRMVPIVASKKEGIENLLDEIIETVDSKKEYIPKQVTYSKVIEKNIEQLMKKFEGYSFKVPYDKRWLAIKVLEEDEDILQRLHQKQEYIEEVGVTKEDVLEEDFESLIADGKYQYISKIISKTVKKPKENSLTTSDKIDKVLTNRWLGLPIFALVMYGVFYFTFDLVGNKFLDMIDVFFSETLSGFVSERLQTLGVSSWLQSLIADGIIGGVGGVLTFLPNIICLFLAISILEDSGYMARVAFIMDRAMRKIGLSGKSFIPMLLGFGCNVPAVMSARTLENENDRLTTILINPFVSCSARLPVYTLFAAAFFPGKEKTVIFSLYILGIVVAIVMAFIFKKTLFKGEQAPFVMELPPYRIPTLKGIGVNVFERVKAFMIKAGTIIFAGSMIIWLLLGYNFSGPTEMSQSLGASIGRIVSPIFAPLGFGNWQASLSLITGILAKEVVVSNMAIIYGMVEDPSASQFLTSMGTTFTSLSAYAFMVFVLLYTPCLAVIGAIKRETGSWKWMFFSIIYQFTIAWFVSMIVFNVGKMIV